MRSNSLVRNEFDCPQKMREDSENISSLRLLFIEKKIVVFYCYKLAGTETKLLQR